MSSLCVTLTSDTSLFDDFVLAELLPAIEASVGVSDRMGKLLDAILVGLDDLVDAGLAVAIECHPAGRAGKLRIVAQPSQRLRDLVAALRAGDIDAAVEQLRGLHGNFPSVAVDGTRATHSPASHSIHPSVDSGLPE